MMDIKKWRFIEKDTFLLGKLEEGSTVAKIDSVRQTLGLKRGGSARRESKGGKSICLSSFSRGIN